MARFVGKMGEHIVSAWAAEAGLVANRSVDHDATGWDLLLEWPTNDRCIDGLPLDRRPSPLHCLVQIKSTDRTAKRCDVKLSNWERLIRTPLPTFFLILEFDGGHQCAAAFLIHVDEYHIRGTLRRLRDASHGGRPLHKHTRAVSWGDAERLESPDGKSLELALRTHMDRSMEEYAAWKANLLATAGYEEETAELNVHFRALPGFSGEPQDLLVRWALGLIPYLEIDGGVLTDIRFGIPSPDPVKTFPEGSLVVEIKPFAQGEVRFFADGIRRHAVLKAEMFLPMGVSHLVPEDAIRVRIRTPFLDFVIGLKVNKLEFSLSLPLPEKDRCSLTFMGSRHLFLS
jgi:hypothetical protein